MADALSPRDDTAVTSPELTTRVRDQSITHSTKLQHLSPLLVYLPEYAILICKSCRFAIQPNALSNHLLRHHVYREKRRDLLNRVAELTLLEPEKVSTPSLIGPPFPHLPIATGYRCTVPDCGHLCISHKRMSQHLHEHHDEATRRHVNNHMEQTHLQTFFKGNRVRYFEVNLDVPPPSKAPESGEPITKYRFLESTFSNRGQTLPTTDPMNRDHEGLEHVFLTDHQMDDLMYLHQYVTCTAYSLTRDTEPIKFWTHDVPIQARTQAFLMHGILGVAAFHKAVLVTDPKERSLSHAAGLRHQSAGLATFRKIIGNPTRHTSMALSAFARLLGVQYCEEALLQARTHSSEEIESANASISKVLEFLLMMTGGCDLLLSMQNLLPAGSGLILSTETLQGLDSLEISPEALLDSTPSNVNELSNWLHSHANTSPSSTTGEPFRVNNLSDVRELVDLCIRISKLLDIQQIRVDWTEHVIPETSSLAKHADLIKQAIRALYDRARILSCNNQPESQLVACPILLCYPYIPPAIYSELESLPGRVLARVPSPSYMDLRAFNQAMAALVSSYSRSYAMDAAWARWNGIESWSRMISDHFLSMVKANNPLALVLVAHWCVLLSRQEQSYWFLQGQSQRMLRAVLNNLDAEFQAFVEDCVFSLTGH